MKLKWLVCALVCPVLSAEAQTLDWATPYPAPRLDLERQAQSLVGTFYAKAIPMFSGGSLDGCGIEYEVLLRDWTYQRGAPLQVGGGFGVKGSRKPLKIGTYLKVIFNDIDPKTLEPKPNAPVEASLVCGRQFY